MKELYKDEFEKQLFEKKVETDEDGNQTIEQIVVEESPEVKRARANVARIINQQMKVQQQERDENKFDVVAVQGIDQFNIGDIKLTENTMSKFTESAYYKVRLNNFEGPLDLLLYLIKDSRLEIKDIKLANITDQYLEYIKDINQIDLEKAAEFIEVAATLVEIKSKSMIPQEQDKVQDENDPEWLLLQRLKEYKLFKEASQQMKNFEVVNQMYKLPDDKAKDFRDVLKQMNIDGLVNAFVGLMNKVAVREIVQEEKTIAKDRWTVEEKMFEIKTLLMNQDELCFDEMVGNDYTRGEVITLFMATLELLKLQIIGVRQTEMFGKIYLTKGESFNAEFGQDS